VAASLDIRIATILHEVSGASASSAHAGGRQEGTTPAAPSHAEVIAAGQALDVLQIQLAAIAAARREWMASQATQDDPEVFMLAPADLVRVPDGLAEQLYDVELSDTMQVIADDYGILIAVHDPHRGKKDAEPTEVEDHVVLRRCRPVSVGVYRRTDRRSWQLDTTKTLVLDVVDEFSEFDHVDLDGSWWRTGKVELAYHPDMSLKTFGVASTPGVSTVVSSFGKVSDAVVAARKADEGAAAKAKASRIKTTLLMEASTEMEVLAAARHG
jgi:hypothetical protein